MTDITTILTCDKCGLLYRASLIPHECAEWTKGRNEHKGDVMERREWRVGSRSSRDATIYEGGQWIAQVGIDYADLIVDDHNQHATLVEQRDRLARVLHRTLDAIEVIDFSACREGSYDSIPWQDIEHALATIEQASPSTTGDEQGGGEL